MDRVPVRLGRDTYPAWDPGQVLRVTINWCY